MRNIYDRFNENEMAAYREGQAAALKFNANHGDIRQDLFKAETDDHRIYIGFDDVEEGVFLDVTFKRRYDRDGHQKKVTVGCGRFDNAMQRALAFLIRHPHHRPYCSVDY